MSASDGSDQPQPQSSQSHGPKSDPRISTLLFESLCYLLIEKGVLTKNDALSVVQTVAQVKLGTIFEEPMKADDAADIQLLRRLFSGFAALDDRPADASFAAGNVHRLRPPIYGERPEFPGDE